MVFLNTLGRSGVFEAHFEDPGFPQQMSGTGRQLPECWKNGRARCQPWQGVIDMMSRVIASEATGWSPVRRGRASPAKQGERQEYIDVLSLHRQSLQNKQCFHNLYAYLSAARNTEDFVMRGLIWSQHYFPADFFNGHIVDEDERNLELPSHAAPRAERCPWLDSATYIFRSSSQQYKVTSFDCILPIYFVLVSTCKSRCSAFRCL
jgi:hypothetical protein